MSEPDFSGTSSINLSGRTVSIGNPGTSTMYRAGKISLGDGETITVRGHVQVRASDGVDIGGGGRIRIETNSSLEIYTDQDVSLQGQSEINKNGRPVNLKIFGTNTKDDDQTLYLGSQADLTGVFYSPDWKVNISLDEDGIIKGSVIGNTIEANSKFKFHYDITLGSGSGGGDSGVNSWMELTGSDQMNFQTYVNSHNRGNL